MNDLIQEFNDSILGFNYLILEFKDPNFGFNDSLHARLCDTMLPETHDFANAQVNFVNSS